MAKNITIRSFIALFSLLVFTMSITPKSVFHDIFAGHIDTIQRAADDGKHHITKTGFNCECNTLVATSPFLEATDEVLYVQPRIFTIHQPGFYSFTHRHVSVVTALRGPPVAA